MNAATPQIGRRRLLAVGTVGAGAAAATLLAGTQDAAASGGPGPVFTDGPGEIVVPYRAFDSRSWPVGQGGGTFLAGQTRTIAVNASVQGPSADHVFLSITVTGTTGAGYLTVFPADRPDVPVTSTINWMGRGQTLSTGLLTRCQVVAGSGLFHQSRIKIHFAGTGQVQVIIDVAATLGH